MDEEDVSAYGSGESAAQPEKKRQRTHAPRSASRPAARSEPSRPNIFRPSSLSQGFASVAKGIGTFVFDSLQHRAPPPSAAAAPSQSSPGADAGRASSAPDSGDPRAPFTPAQRWLDAALADSIQTALVKFGGRCDRQLDEVRASVEDVRFEASEAAVAASAAKGLAATTAEQTRTLSSKVDTHDSALKALETKLAALEVSVSENRAVGSGASAAASSEAPSIPYERRQHAIVANLGWDEQPADLVERAVAVLCDAGVPRDAWSHLSPVLNRDGRGSAAEMWFHDPTALQKARLAVRALRRTYVEARTVWLDARRERAEVLPVKITHRLAQALSEAGVPQVVKDVPGRSVRSAGTRIAYAAQGRVRWTAAAAPVLSPEQREAAASFAEAS